MPHIFERETWSDAFEVVTNEAKKHAPLVIDAAQAALLTITFASVKGLYLEILNPQSEGVSQALRFLSLLGSITSTANVAFNLQQLKSGSSEPKTVNAKLANALLSTTAAALTARTLYGSSMAPTFTKGLATYGAIELLSAGYSSFFKSNSADTDTHAVRLLRP